MPRRHSVVLAGERGDWATGSFGGKVSEARVSAARRLRRWVCWGGVGVAVLAVAGGILCLAWRSLISSFGQLNRGKFQVINYIERYLKASIYAAEWEALGRGEDPKIYRSFTSREIWVPNALFWLYIGTIVVSLAVSGG